jgi:hypothetical protein
MSDTCSGYLQACAQIIRQGIQAKTTSDASIHTIASRGALFKVVHW